MIRVKKEFNFNKPDIDQKGFTLIEMMVSVVISLIILSSIMGLFISQHKAYEIQDQVAEMQQNIRVAMNELTENIRMAGYDPQGSGIFGITDVNFSNSDSAGLALTASDLDKIYFTTDIDGVGDGIIGTTTNERVGYKLDSGDLKVGSSISSGVIGSWMSLAENITALTFTYTFADGGTGLPDNTNSVREFKDIRAIEVSVTARTSREDPGYTGGFDLNTGIAGTCRTRTLTAKVRPMNLGL